MMTFPEMMAVVAQEGIEGEIPAFPASPTDQLALLLPHLGQPVSSLPRWMVMSLEVTDEVIERVQELPNRLMVEPLWMPEGEEDFL